jgi:putative endonuclease
VAVQIGNPFIARFGQILDKIDLMGQRQEIGHWGEAVALEFLLNKGFSAIGRNVRTPYGEIDLIMYINAGIRFVEVKTRTSTTLGPPEISVGPQKMVHLTQSAQAYMQAHPELGDSYQIDVLAITGRPGDPSPQIEWFENAIS